MDWTDLLNEAEKIAEAYDQDWDNGITWFEYADGSVAAFHSQTEEIYPYGSRD